MTTLGRSALATTDIIVTQGADNTYAFRYSVDDGNGPTAVDLTTWTARSQLRRKVGGDVWHTMTQGAGITLGADGTVVVHIDDTVTQAPEWDRYSKVTDGEPQALGVWDLELASPTGHVVRLVEGTVTVSPDVTRVSA